MKHCSRWSKLMIAPAIAFGVCLIAGCAEPPLAETGIPSSRISFRVDAPATQRIFEVQRSDCFLPSDPQNRFIMDMSYDPNVTTLIRFSGPRRVGMPVTGKYPESSYAETRVAAGHPLTLRFRVFVGNNIYGQVYKELSFTPESNADYEILTKFPDGPRGLKADIQIAQITQEGNQVKLSPVPVSPIPLCTD